MSSEVQEFDQVRVQQWNRCELSLDTLLRTFVIGEVHRDAVLDTLREHDISGRIFVSLTEDDLKDLFPVLGERLSIMTVLRQLNKREYSKQQQA